MKVVAVLDSEMVTSKLRAVPVAENSYWKKSL
jgi:hypothetical protein